MTKIIYLKSHSSKKKKNFSKREIELFCVYVHGPKIKFIFLPLVSLRILVRAEKNMGSSFFVVQSLSRVQFFVTPWTAACQSSLSFPISQNLFRFISTESVMTSKSSHPLSPPSLPALNLSQDQGLFWWVDSASGGQVLQLVSASGLPMNIYDWFPLGLTGLISLQSKRLSRVFSRTTIWKHQFFSAQLSLWPNSRIHTWLLEKP